MKASINPVLQSIKNTKLQDVFPNPSNENKEKQILLTMISLVALSALGSCILAGAALLHPSIFQAALPFGGTISFLGAAGAFLYLPTCFAIAACKKPEEETLLA